MKAVRCWLVLTGAVLLVASLGPAAARADGLPVLGVDVGASGVVTPSGDARYVTIPAGSRTVLARVSRNGGRIVASTVLPATYTIPAVAYDGSASGLSGDGRTLVLTFSQKLPDYAKYLVRVTGVRDLAGNALAGDNDRILTALLGDATGDRRVNNTDVGAVESLRGTDPISTQDVNQIRSDVTNDGRVNNTDVGGILSVRGKDARFIADPTPASLQSVTTLGAELAVVAPPLTPDAQTAAPSTLVAPPVAVKSVSPPPAVKSVVPPVKKVVVPKPHKVVNDLPQPSRPKPSTKHPPHSANATTPIASKSVLLRHPAPASASAQAKGLNPADDHGVPISPASHLTQR
jgi:hypothetical protein